MSQPAGRNEPGAFGISAQTARVLADPWRYRIVMELSVRMLSPSRFVDQIGGELTHISRCFRLLKEWGYIELVDIRDGPRKGAAVEHVYRGIQRAHFDTSSWEKLSSAYRNTLSNSTLSSYFEHINEAIGARTFDEEIDRHLSWDGVVLDRIAWVELVTRLDCILAWLPTLETQAAERMMEEGQDVIPTMVGLAAFRSPQTPETVLGAPRRHQEPGEAPSTPSPFSVSPKMTKALSNRWCSRILMELNVRPMSPSQFKEEIGGSWAHVSRCFSQLADWGLIELVDERRGGRRGGGVERVYRNTQRAYFDTVTWETLPLLLREEVSNSCLASYLERINEAFKAQTFDAEKDRHLSWKPVALDRIAWSEITTCLDKTLDWLPELETEATKRLEQTGTEPISTTVGLAAFRSPKRSM